MKIDELKRFLPQHYLPARLLPPPLRRLALAAIVLSSALALPADAAETDLSGSLTAIARADGTASVDRAAAQAAQKLQSLPSTRVTDVLAGFTGASKRGRNWLRALAADVSDNGDFPKSSLLAFFADRSNDADARYVAFQLLTQHDAGLKSDLLGKAQTDPSLPIRYLKIQSMIEQAATLMADQSDAAIEILREVVANGRSPKQLEKAAKMLSDLDVNVDLANELGMMRRWWGIGPFDNTASTHFDTVYAPEKRYLQSGVPFAVDASGNKTPDQGKQRAANWTQISSDDSLGMVDLNEPLANEKDAAAYVFTKFKIAGGESIPNAQIRIGCITSNKVWINGQLVAANDVYHSGTRIDQYVEDCQLKDGENSVLIKVMQNAQTEPWAQDWQFQFRLTRPDGSAIQTIPID